MLREALESFQPKAGPHYLEAYQGRAKIAEAMQQLAPDQPRPLFTLNDTPSIRALLRSPELQGEPERLQAVTAAAVPVLVEASGFGVEFTPDQLRRLLASLREADAATHEAVLSRVLEIDPHFAPASAEAAELPRDASEIEQ